SGLADGPLAGSDWLGGGDVAVELAGADERSAADPDEFELAVTPAGVQGCSVAAEELRGLGDRVEQPALDELAGGDRGAAASGRDEQRDQQGEDEHGFASLGLD